MTWWTPGSTILQNGIALRQPTPEISLTKNPADTHTHTKKTNSKRYIHNSACVDNKYARCPDWRISPHADRRSPITAKHKIGRHARDIRYKSSCGQTNRKKQTVNDISTACLSACVDNKYASCAGLFFTRSATVGQVRRTVLTTVKRVINFSIFWPRKLTPGPKFIKMGDPYPKNFSPIAPTMYEICVTKVFHFLALGG